MADEIAQLKAALAALNTQCQLARDNEVRHALQRGRLEAERAQLLVKLMEALAAPAELVVPPLPVIIREPSPPAIPAGPAPASTRRTQRPEGLPTTASMVVTALREAGKPSRPKEIAAYIRKRWWPDMSVSVISPVVWHMAQDGRLTSHQGRYSVSHAALNGQG
jgi:hypothetical protein